MRSESAPLPPIVIVPLSSLRVARRESTLIVRDNRAKFTSTLGWTDEMVILWSRNQRIRAHSTCRWRADVFVHILHQRTRTNGDRDLNEGQKDAYEVVAKALAT